jgi:hypothetical protein
VQDAFCSLLLNAFEWRLRFKIWNWVGTLSFHGTAVIFWDIVRPMLTESFPFNYMLKSKFSLSRHFEYFEYFEYANEQITYHFWLNRNYSAILANLQITSYALGV